MINAPVTIMEAANTKRVTRRPSHPFNLAHNPFTIAPFMIAPVLAGETLKNLLIQSRAVTDRVKSPLIGWWLEHYFFYVRLRDLEERETIEDMLLDMSASTASLQDAVASPRYYHHSGINWAKLCLKRITDEYFRDDGEIWSDQVDAQGLPKAQINNKSWMDSVHGNAEMPTDTIDGDPPIATEDFEAKYRTWLYLRNQKLVEMDFEQYLESFGVRQTLAQKNKPELLRFCRNWTYPTNTVDPDTGTPSTCLSWSISERADKDRFFAEPGFIIGVTVSRPKVYLSNQREHAAHLLNTTLSWLPAIMKNDPSSSIQEVPAGTGPLGGVHTSASYWVDIRDLFLYGDQWINPSGGSGYAYRNEVLATITNNGSKYAGKTEIEALFTDPAKFHTFQDGIVSLNILGTQMDYT